MRTIQLAVTACLAWALCSPAEAQCGNGRYEPPAESCDDMNTVGGDGCDGTCSVEAGYTCINPPSLTGIVAESYAGAGASWTVSADGLSGIQTANTAAPTIGLIGADAQELTYTFDLTVETTTDDDFIGFVLGFNPGDASNASADYLLIDWKQGPQSGATAGMALSRVTGLPSPGFGGDFWTHSAGAGGAVTEIARAAAPFGTTGWADNVTYRFVIDYTPTNLTITVARTTAPATAPVTVFNQNAPAGQTWPAGEIGFYGFSQQDVRYTVILPPPSVCDLDEDGDRIFDIADADADGDGIADVAEMPGFAGDPDNDTDGDGVPDWADPDQNTMCVSDGGAPARCVSLPAGQDPDMDGIPNHLDLDSDGDGIPDVFESGNGALAGPDGRLSSQADADRDGIADLVDTAPADPLIATTTTVPPNTDLTDAVDYLDPDSDNDGLSDAVEAHDENGDGVIAGVEHLPVMNDHDGDGIDDAFDADCADVGIPAGCLAAGSAVGLPLAGYQDEDGDGLADWLETCGDAYVRGAEGCDDANGVNTDACNNVCLITDGSACAAGAGCASGICNMTTGTCQLCDDTMMGAGIDQGCTTPAPVCALDMGVAGCAVCAETSMMASTPDDGCSAASPVCLGTTASGGPGTSCVQCAATADCASGVCDVATNACVVCVDSGPGMDTGCMGGTPFCDPSTPGGACVQCLADVDCPGIQGCVMGTCAFPDTDGDGLTDDVDVDDDGDGIPDAVETGGVDRSIDSDGDAIPDYLDPDVVACMDVDADGRCDALPPSVDLDGDGLPNHLDLDADGDGIPDTVEGHDADQDGVADVAMPAGSDMDMDGLDDAYDPDNGGRAAPVQDTDGDTRPDFLDGDSDDDGLPDRLEAFDTDGDGIQDVLRSGRDVDGDGIDDAFDPSEGGASPTLADVDGDGRPAYLDLDSDGDGVPETLECSDPTACPDTDGDGTADYLDVDADGDGILDAIEGFDVDGDGVADVMPSGVDANNNGLDDALDPAAMGRGAFAVDHDGDGVPDLRDVDDDGDGIGTASECPSPSAGCPDTDGDGAPDYLDPDGPAMDSDMDGIPDTVECDGNVATCRDSDGDGLADHLDDDDDGDGVPTARECPGGPTLCDADGDGRPNHLDLDSDGDGIVDGEECAGADACEDTDADGVPDIYDLDSDGDGIVDAIEGHDADADGVPDRVALGVDVDLDGLDDAFDPDQGGTASPLPDTDSDGRPDYRDADDDGDGIATSLECVDPSMTCPDTDSDGAPDYLDASSVPVDTDGDGIPDVVECPPPGDPVGAPASCPDTDGDGNPDFDDPDDDGDGIPTREESYDGDGDPTDDDTDRDGVPDYLDDDDDNDNVPTAMECASFAAGCPDTDGDGRPDYLDVCGDGRVSTWDDVTAWEQCDDGNTVAGDGCDPTCRTEDGDRDTDGDGLLDSVECPAPGNPRTPSTCVDTDGDGRPDFDDPDDDGDGVPTADELAAGPAVRDTDGDGVNDHLDPDDDGDGVPTLVELGDPGSPRNTDGDEAPDYLDPDDDNDSIPTADELGDGPSPRDTDGDGDADYIDPDDDGDTIPTRTEVADGAALTPPNPDVDGDGLSNWLDPDADGDGVTDGDEPGDADGNGVPDYLEASQEPVVGGLSGGALCSVRQAGSRGAPLAWALLAAALVFARRRRR